MKCDLRPLPTSVELDLAELHVRSAVAIYRASRRVCPGTYGPTNPSTLSRYRASLRCALRALEGLVERAELERAE